MNIYVGNLPQAMTKDKLESLFKEFGEIENVKVIKDRFSGRPKGYGFVEMPSNSEADKAIKALNGNNLDGSFIKVVAWYDNEYGYTCNMLRMVQHVSK